MTKILGLQAPMELPSQPQEGVKFHKRNRFFREVTRYVWDGPILFRIGVDNLLMLCVTKGEQASILWHCHNSPYGGQFNGERTTAKILHNHAQSCDSYQ